MGITPNLTSVASSATSVTILAGNPQRKGARIQNTSTAILYLRFGTGAATDTTAHNVQLAANTAYELPTFEANGTSHCYTGQITGIWAAENGQANVTEFV